MFKRRASRVVNVGHLKIGGNNPVVVQSMVTANTMDTKAVVDEVKALVDVGCQMVRITAPTVGAAKNLGVIKQQLHGVKVALVADIHFQAAAAMEAALYVDKVRINPGNFCESQAQNLEDSFKALLDICSERGVAIRIGTNHGSLSERMMKQFGNTSAGMVESALEFLRIARKYKFDDIILSMKASNPRVMIDAYRSLVESMDLEGMDYPLHLGVTEAGDGEDGRIKSAIGIGSLLSDGIGDTIRVSLTEDAVCEIPVAKDLLSALDGINKNVTKMVNWPKGFVRRITREIKIGDLTIGAKNPVCVGVSAKFVNQNNDTPVELLFTEHIPDKKIKGCSYCVAYKSLVDAGDITNVDAVLVNNITELKNVAKYNVTPIIKWSRNLDLDGFEGVVLLEVNSVYDVRLALDFLLDLPVILKTSGSVLANAVKLGSALCDGYGDGILIDDINGDKACREAYTILQSSGSRLTRTDFIACPSCGRTLFNLQETTARVKAVTSHLKGVKIAIMGCIVNGPGEMADADFGYVGGAPDKINLYVGKKCVRRSIPSHKAVDELVDLLKSEGVWVDINPKTS